MKVKFNLTIVLFFICLFIYSISHGLEPVDNMKAAKWFLTIFQGNWVQVPDKEPIPSKWVLDDSEHWASVFLQDSFNPYKKGAEYLEQKMFLGLGTSSDKLITYFVTKDPKKHITIYETLQNYIITIETVGDSVIKNSNDALLLIQSEFSIIFKDEVRNFVQKTIDETLKKNTVLELTGTIPVVFSYSCASINSIINWNDRINLVWFEDKLYINFYKTFPGSSSGTFRQGNDWYPKELRTKLNIKR